MAAAGTRLAHDGSQHFEPPHKAGNGFAVDGLRSCHVKHHLFAVDGLRSCHVKHHLFQCSAAVTHWDITLLCHMYLSMSHHAEINPHSPHAGMHEWARTRAQALAVVPRPRPQASRWPRRSAPERPARNFSSFRRPRQPPPASSAVAACTPWPSRARIHTRPSSRRPRQRLPASSAAAACTHWLSRAECMQGPTSADHASTHQQAVQLPHAPPGLAGPECTQSPTSAHHVSTHQQALQLPCAPPGPAGPECMQGPGGAHGEVCGKWLQAAHANKCRGRVHAFEQVINGRC